jgi:two-component system nitrate/nitrite response regulator NarL
MIDSSFAAVVPTERTRPGATTAEPLRILVIAAYPAVRAGLSALLAGDAELRPMVVSTISAGRARASDGDVATAPDPAVIVVDLSGGGEPATDDVADAYPGVPLVLLGGTPGVDGPGLGDGPVAYLAPDVDGPSLVAAVRSVALGLTVIDPVTIGAAGIHAHGRTDRAHPGHPVALNVAGEPLTVRERQVLELVASGLPNKAIARELGISEHTAKFHVGSLLGKLGAGSRTEAVTLATRRGLLAV